MYSIIDVPSIAPYILLINGEVLRHYLINRILQLRILRLDNNKIDNIPEGILEPFKNLYVINLSHNNLTGESLKGLIGLKNLRVIILNSNNIKDIPQEVLDGLPKLSFIAIYDNPISAKNVNILRHKGYWVSVLPITRENIRKAGVTSLWLVSLILTAASLKKILSPNVGKTEFPGRPISQGELRVSQRELREIIDSNKQLLGKRGAGEEAFKAQQKANDSMIKRLEAEKKPIEMGGRTYRNEPIEAALEELRNYNEQIEAEKGIL